MMNKIVALYKFVDIKDPEFISEKIRNKLDELNIYGTILIGHEGINGTYFIRHSSKPIKCFKVY